MKKPFFALLMAAALVPFAAVPTMAQTPPDSYGPPPAVRAQLEQIRATYKTNAFNALSQAHRTQVDAILSQVNAGTLDRRTAAQQIDQLLSPNESQAILTQGKSMREAMRKVFEANAPQDGAQQPMGPPPGAQGQPGPNGEQHVRRAPDAGRMLIMLGTNRRMRPPSSQPQ